jgi:hypothetical protein
MTPTAALQPERGRQGRAVGGAVLRSFGSRRPIVASQEVAAADSDIAATTRHKPLQTIMRYRQAAEQRLRAPHRLKGVGLKHHCHRAGPARCGPCRACARRT